MGEIARSVLAGTVHRLNTIKGGRFISNSSLAKAVCGTGPAVADLRCGSKAIVLLQDHVGRAMYLWGQHDPRVARVMDAVIGTGDTVLDIGANFGVLGLLAARKVGSEGRVHLFEPQSLVAQCLRASLALNEYRHAEIHECALSSYSGFSEMAIVEPGNLGMTQIVPPDCNLRGQRIQVRVENAADYIPALPVSQGEIIVKIDVEGHEGEILGAMRAWIGAVAPAFVLFECHVGDGGFWEEKSVAVLAALNYRFFGYDLTRYTKTQLYRLSPYDKFPAGYDFVALHSSVFETARGACFQRTFLNEV
jgi:FkbM family methyltransferase